MDKISSWEQETLISYNNKEQIAEVSTYDAKVIRRLDKLITGGNADIKVVQRYDDFGAEYVQYEVPKRWIVVRPPKKMNYTDEQKAAMSERLRMLKDQRGNA